MAHASLTVGARGLTVALAALLLGACASTSLSSSASSSPSAVAPSPASAGVTSVAVVEKEFSITLAKEIFAPGRYTFTMKNQGKFPHNLIVEGPGIDKQKSPTLMSGKSGSLTVTLQKGTYELWCGVDSHKDKGMDKKITVG